jgi:hypothetical protein
MIDIPYLIMMYQLSLIFRIQGDYGILMECVTREEKFQLYLSTVLAEGAGKPSGCCVAVPLQTI